ncbi:MAG: UDP-N-acetylmuramate dehydrogenase [Acidobacteriota bacterium]
MPASDTAGLPGLDGLDVRWDAPLGPLTSLKVGGRVTAVVSVKTEEELARTISAAAAGGLPWMVLGAGSNLLVPDGKTDAIVVRLAGVFRDVEDLPRDRVRAGAAVKCGALARKLAARGLGGLEFAAGIPGTIGGAVAMNAGYATRSTGDVLERARLLAPGGAIAEAVAADLELAYRCSRVRRTREVVLSATLVLERRDPAELLARIREGDAHRARTQPLTAPSCGSVFKNPPGDHAGRLIDAAGLKGERAGGAEVSHVHANFIVTAPGATAADVETLIARIQERVASRSGVALAREVLRLEECLVRTP